MAKTMTNALHYAKHITVDIGGTKPTINCQRLFDAYLAMAGELGASVALSGDGLIMAAGAPMNSEKGSFVGCIKVLQYSDVGDAWGLLAM